MVLLMLTGGYVPCLPCWPIKEIKLQGKIDGFDTDDLIVFVEKNNSGERRKLLGQVKHTIGITQGNRIFSEVIQAAWSDFTNQQLFQKGRDAIALLTGPLNATDSHNVQWLLNHAKHTKSVDEFFRNVAQAKFSPPQSGEKLKVFQHHLKAANKNIDVSPDELYAFLNHFHWLGYDLGCETGVVLSLLHSHISQFNQQYPEWAWSRVVDIVQTWNQDAGTIIREKLPEDLRNAFKQPVIVPIPKELVTAQLEIVKRDWNQSRYATDLALTNLAGAWDEKNQADVVILSQLLREEYSAWVPTARDILHLPDSPFSLKNGLWKITDRVDLWEAVGSRIFDQTLDTFKTIVVAVLTEPNPAFDLPPDERFAASIHGKILAHSPALRQGLSEGLALLGCKPNLLVNCSIRKAETTAITTIREIFTDANWVLWASLDKLLPTLAEAAPDEFLKAVENALRLTPCPFDELFAQESAGITGTNYLSGLLWALEGLAWDEKHFVRVCIILGELANHDPGGKWANRPENSLTNILLPWLPQTLAPFEKRKVAVQTLCKEWPRIGWKLVIQLLPSDHQVSMGSHKPSWRNPIPDNWEKGVTKGEYWQQVSYYAEFAILLAGQNPVRLAELIDHFANLPKPAFDKLIKVLSSDAIGNLPEDQRLVLWGHLTRFSSRHRKYSDTKWALGDELLSPIEAVAVKIAPSNPVN
ncbi:MAG TPA: hypothetical protein PKZ53_14840, partial [Acidobacteriota bacterium]|nr:hypothetical protein [Acidobacteriota bacterium]